MPGALRQMETDLPTAACVRRKVKFFEMGKAAGGDDGIFAAEG